jgi:beta-galactosidase
MPNKFWQYTLSFFMRRTTNIFIGLLLTTTMFPLDVTAQSKGHLQRTRVLINNGWKFHKYNEGQKPDLLIYDVRPEVTVDADKIAADAQPTEGIKVSNSTDVLKPYILPTGNDFLKDPAGAHRRPSGNPGADFPFVKKSFDDSAWKTVNLPHDWAINGPFYTDANALVGGGMGRLPVQGVGWYRRKLNISRADLSKSIFLEVDGAMSYAVVWLNGKLVGGWPNGYSSWSVDLTPFLIVGADNQLAIRLDNPLSSSRWYPGGGIYRNVWLTKVAKVHVAHWGTFLKTSEVSDKSAKITLELKIENDSKKDQLIQAETSIFLMDKSGNRIGSPLASITPRRFVVKASGKGLIQGSVVLKDPKRWFPLPQQNAQRYVALTTLSAKGKILDVYSTPFGIREVKFDPNLGLLINGKKTPIKGVNQHSDLGPLGMAFNERAATRQLEMLRELGCNAIRMSHNPPAPELLDLCDKMGFMVVDEIFDSWERKKTPLDFHLIFPDWSEQDLRSLIRRDRNHPSVILWSFGNEVGEQYTDQSGALVAKRLYDIVKDEDPTRLTTIAMNYAKPDMPLSAVADVIGLNYQGEGIRNGEAYSGLKGVTSAPMFPAFHQQFPEKTILSTENAAALSSRGEYLFPVYSGNSAPVSDTLGGSPNSRQVSAYELYSVGFGASADKVFATMAKHPFVAGGFAWTGWDYLGEPSPYYTSRSSYFGIIDLAGFKKDRFYLYQSQWCPELPMVHLLPHWNWPGRTGKLTPVHVFTSGDQAELFLNGKSMGRKKMGESEYRLRWDEVKYEPGELKVVAYKNGKLWAQQVLNTTGNAAKLLLSADRSQINNDGDDLSFITVKIADKNNLTVPDAKSRIHFSIQGPGEIVAADNGDATDMTAFSAPERKAFNGLALVIVRFRPGSSGPIKLTATSNGLKSGSIEIKAAKAR